MRLPILRLALQGGGGGENIVCDLKKVRAAN